MLILWQGLPPEDSEAPTTPRTSSCLGPSGAKFSGTTHSIGLWDKYGVQCINVKLQLNYDKQISMHELTTKFES
jgi:hypothetical protein